MENLHLGYVLAGMLNFAILYFLFKHFLADHLTKLIDERRRQLKDLADSEAVVKEKLDAANIEANRVVDDARKKADDIQRNAEEIAKQTSKNTIEKAESKAQNILDAAQREIEKEEKEMWEKLKEKVLGVSLKVNEKLFDDSGKNKEFLEKEINSIKM